MFILILSFDSDEFLFRRVEKIMLVSGMNESEKKMCSRVTEELGAVLINSVGFDSRCTHLIVRKHSTCYSAFIRLINELNLLIF